MARSRSRKQGDKSNTSQNLLPFQGKMLWVLMAAIAIAAVVFFLGTLILETIGFGFILLALWAAAVVWVLWRSKMHSLLRWWNLWLSAILFSLAIWGILALFHPTEFILGKADFTEVSLGGNAGESFIGNQGVGVPPAVRLTILILGGIILIIPGPSFKSLRLV